MKTIPTISLLFCLYFLSSCTAPKQIVRAATNVPTAFVASEGMSLSTEACISPLIDPRDNTQLLLLSSRNQQGDYSVPEGRYGVAEGERLRIDCSTGKVLGIVR